MGVHTQRLLIAHNELVASPLLDSAMENRVEYTHLELNMDSTKH